MKDLIKKSMLLGLGAASLTREKVEKLAKQFVSRKAITRKDAEMIVKTVLKEASRYRKKLDKMSGPYTAKLKRRAASLESELMKRGKKTAKGLLKRTGRGI